MAITTDIEWCDSSLNIMSGCDGCELWNRAAGVKHCYAGTLTDRYGRRPGWPDSFEKPKLFLNRLDAALKWSDLTGKDRPGKPWLNGHARMVFLNDMGDTFTESLPDDWLAPLLPRLADSPHVWMILTKRGQRMRAFSERHPFPENVWPGVSLTTQRSAARASQLQFVQGGGVRFVSAEPLWGSVTLEAPLGLAVSSQRQPNGPVESFFRPTIGLVIVGGQSGPKAKPMHPDWARSLRDQCVAAGVPYFFKQWGEWMPSDKAPDPDPVPKTILKGSPAECVVMKRPPRAICWVDHDGPVKIIGDDGRFTGDSPRGECMSRVGKKAAGRLLDGREWSEFPEPATAKGA